MMRVLQSIVWRQLTDQPPATARLTGVLAYYDDESGWVLDSEIYQWDGQAWSGEFSGRAPRAGMYWTDEAQMVTNLNKTAAPARRPTPEAA